MVYFPWGINRKGFILDNSDRQKTIKRANKILFFVLGIPCVIAVGQFKYSIWQTTAWFVGGTVLYLLATFLFVKYITRSLALSSLGYKEILAENFQQDDPDVEDKELDRIVARAIASKRYKLTQPEVVDPYSLKYFLYRYHREAMFAAWALLIAVIIAWFVFTPGERMNRPEAPLVFSVVLFIIGLACYLTIRQRMEEKARIWRLIEPGLGLVFCWGMSIYLLLRFITGLAG